jgi:catechol 2,3-dioxygenase-like lactoylglutathione lyase family enzyme
VKARRILHASVNVSGKLAEAGAFYRDLLGLEVAERPEIPGVGGTWFAVGDGQVHLVDAPSRGAGIDPTGHHFCLGVDDISEALAELEARGIEHVTARQGEVLQVWVTDPAGNTIELQQLPAGP